jgi:hypothetical protein
MKFDSGIGKKYKLSIEQAFETILDLGNDHHREVIDLIRNSRMQIRVLPVSKVNASGVTGLISPRETNNRIEDERLTLADAIDQVYITIAEETIDTGGQRGCEGTFVHEGRHAYDFAQTVASFSDADFHPLSVFDPTLYELEWEAHITSGEYMLSVNKDEYLAEGVDLLILGRNSDGTHYLNPDGIRTRLRDNYGLIEDTHPGRRASQLLGIDPR